MTEDQINALHRRAMTAPHPAWPCGKARLLEIVQLQGDALRSALQTDVESALERAGSRAASAERATHTPDMDPDACAAACAEARARGEAACLRGSVGVEAMAAWIETERDAIVNPPEQQQAQVSALDVRIEAVEFDLATVKADLGIL